MGHCLPPFLAPILAPHPGRTASVLSVVSRAGVRCMMGVVGKAERQRERRVHEDEAVASHDFAAGVLFASSLVEGFGLSSQVL